MNTISANNQTTFDCDDFFGQDFYTKTYKDKLISRAGELFYVLDITISPFKIAFVTYVKPYDITRTYHMTYNCVDLEGVFEIIG